jgi:hypothetical protein
MRRESESREIRLLADCLRRLVRRLASGLQRLLGMQPLILKIGVQLHPKGDLLMVHINLAFLLTRETIPDFRSNDRLQRIFLSTIYFTQKPISLRKVSHSRNFF